MKSYKNLYKEFVSDDNIKLAIINASKGKRERKEVKAYYLHFSEREILDEIKDYADNFYNYRHKPKRIYDGIRKKEREIIVPAFREQIIHHMLINILKPIFSKGMYEHSYGSIPDRGLHLAKRRINLWLKRDFRNTKYFLKMDIHHFFNTIPHDILKIHLSKIIKDSEFLRVLFKVIDATDEGLPLGFYTSQWLANWYLQDLDHYIKEQLGAKYYVRYMDDMVVFGSNKRKLHKTKDRISEFLKSLGLELKENWFVSRFVYQIEDKYIGRDLDFIGFRFFRFKTILRKTLMLRISRLISQIRKSMTITVHRCRQIISYLGWIRHSDSYSFFQNRIKPFVTVRYIKNRIRRYDRRLLCGTNQVIQTMRNQVR